jgi:hypothetical protein
MAELLQAVSAEFGTKPVIIGSAKSSEQPASEHSPPVILSAGLRLAPSPKHRFLFRKARHREEIPFRPALLGKFGEPDLLESHAAIGSHGAEAHAVAENNLYVGVLAAGESGDQTVEPSACRGAEKGEGQHLIGATSRARTRSIPCAPAP